VDALEGDARQRRPTPNGARELQAGGRRGGGPYDGKDTNHDGGAEDDSHYPRNIPRPGLPRKDLLPGMPILR
jgi:hypothetical protein